LGAHPGAAGGEAWHVTHWKGWHVIAVHTENAPKILVTGATGFVGSHLIRRLIACGYETYAVARRAEKLIEIVGQATGDRLTILEGDLLNNANIALLEKDFATQVKDLDFVVHLVGGGPLTSNTAFAREITDLNYTTTVHLLRILENTCKLSSISLFVYCSSLAAMGIPATNEHRILYSEAAACNPMLPYEKAKLQTETLLGQVAMQHNLKTLILRLPQIYGSANDPLVAVVNLMKKSVFPAVRNRVGSLPLIHVDDVVKAVRTAIENHGRIGAPSEINLLCEKSYGYDDLAKMVRNKYGKGGILKMPFWVLYASLWVVEVVFAAVGKPEPLNRRRLFSMTKDRVIDCRKFVENFGFEFDHDVQSFLNNDLV
jgi:nucleoside-diphosphate-sugar epimerase